MNNPINYLVILLSVFALIGANTPERQSNLVSKIQLNKENLGNLAAELTPYYSQTLFQTDTYFSTNQGWLKLREENKKDSYLIRYQIPDPENAKQPHYLFYPVNDVGLFLAILRDSLKEEIKIKKQRTLYRPKPHIHIHLDQVEDLGDFLKIEIFLSEEVPLSLAETEIVSPPFFWTQICLNYFLSFS